MKTIELEKLPALDIVKQVSHAEIVEKITAYAALENMSPADPAYRVALAAGYREFLLRQEANEQALGLTLAHARGPQQDHIAATYYKHPDGEALLRLSGESDESFQKRIQQSPEGLSVAGPRGAYEFIVRSASPQVKDVEVNSPSPMIVNVYVLTHDGAGDASGELLQEIAQEIEPKRPIGDQVSVLTVEVVNFSLSASLFFKSGLAQALALEAAKISLSRYLSEQHQIKGRVVESGVHAALTVEGVEKVVLLDWQDVECSFSQAPYCQSPIVLSGGSL